MLSKTAKMSKQENCEKQVAEMETFLEVASSQLKDLIGID